MSFIRLRDRQAAIQPESEGIQSTAFSNRKRVAEEVKEGGLDNIDWDEMIDAEPTASGPVMFPAFTQRIRVEKVEISSEIKYRVEKSPCIKDLLEIRRIYLKKKEREDKEEAIRQEKRRIMEEKRLKLEESIREGKLAIAPDIDDDEKEDEEEQDEEFKAAALVLKERKICTQRNSIVHHREFGNFERYRKALAVALRTVKHSRMSTEVLPWLILGRGDIISNIHFLLKMGVTHILNCTKDIPNHHSSKFVYQRIPIDDNLKEDAGARFHTAISFLERVEQCRGKVYVHCNVGASRAPTMVMAYLIDVRKFSLLDAYELMHVLRPMVNPNTHFLFQLAQLEIKQNLGCSVIFHKDWRFYEFNNIRSSHVAYRKPEGLFKTALRLYSNISGVFDGRDELGLLPPSI